MKHFVCFILSYYFFLFLVEHFVLFYFKLLFFVLLVEHFVCFILSYYYFLLLVDHKKNKNKIKKKEDEEVSQKRV